MSVKPIFLFLSAVLLLASAYISVSNPYLPMPFPKPAHFPEPVYDFTKFPLTKVKIALGRRLFYDPSLSKDGSVSCGSCHQQASAFTQHGHRLSHGINDSLTEHNAMPLMNLAWHNKFGWDGGIQALDLFPVSPLQHPHEMGERLPNVLKKLHDNDAYRLQFLDAFASDEVSSDHLLQALSQFMLTLISATSRYDKFLRQESPNLSEEENQGRLLFAQKCASCHSGVLLTDLSLRNNGLKIINPVDIGLAKITLKDTDRNKFKVPSLRNITVTAPYMHDGRFKTLEDVLNHYEGGITQSATLDPILSASGKKGIRMTKQEKQRIIQFLHTLTDEQFMTDGQFAEPETEAMYLQRIDFPLATIRPELRQQFEPVQQTLLRLQAAAQAANTLLMSDVSHQLKQHLHQVNTGFMNQAQHIFFAEQLTSMNLEADHIIRVQEIEHQKQHMDTLLKKGKLLTFAFKLPGVRD